MLVDIRFGDKSTQIRFKKKDLDEDALFRIVSTVAASYGFEPSRFLFDELPDLLETLQLRKTYFVHIGRVGNKHECYLGSIGESRA